MAVHLATAEGNAHFDRLGHPASGVRTVRIHVSLPGGDHRILLRPPSFHGCQLFLSPGRQPRKAQAEQRQRRQMFHDSMNLPYPVRRGRLL